MQYRILVVEDNDHVFGQYETAIEDMEGSSGADTLILLQAKNKYDAEVHLKNGGFQAVIMDLKIPVDQADKNSDPSVGIQLLKDTLSRSIFPVIVVSATPNAIDNEDFRLPAKLLKLPKNTGFNVKAIEHLLELRTLLKILPDLDKAKQDFNKDFIDTFWDLYGHWDRFEEKFQDSSRVQKVLKRHISNYLVEKWKADSDYGDLHYSEFYLYPSVREKYYTGDIVEYDESTWIIATPPCDMERQYPTNIILLKCEFIEHADDRLNKITKFKEQGKIEANKGSVHTKVAEFFTKQEDHEYILPPFENSGSSLMLVNFKELMTIQSSKITDLKRKTTLNSYFLPNLLQRYGSYISRLGQPEICSKDFLQYLINQIPEPVSTP